MTAIEERVAFLEGTVTEQARRIDGIREAIEARFAALDAKVESRFLWLIGIQVTTLVAIVAALLAR